MNTEKTPEAKEKEASPAELLTELLEKYAHPEDSKEHAKIAGKIIDAIAARNREKLLMQLEYFGNARIDKSSDSRAQMVEVSCARESRAVIRELEAVQKVNWEELSKAVGI
ncbi:MAG: hypothetical protein A3H69_04490 [Candidatus Sungbacteria bacterium RIFCSPLOWO2_02_FULL_47_9]|uniref:Uncharacterized protein n=1 Tax=Candidatus Sungbacteria bacterium RIFCSPHIGHO2_01_FULL_47_32 TaxID=1802264 RepID=A0A1G2K767_9BACT|nr:MAG: hypothetical protein UX72_C0001G0072 [Parcubacteria group bacterium GW2011_GWA2_47_10]OGZ95276.1 MAG: hypothetical protein A2633_06150 [Candidatus Sungbacteria bacterium RIFCSPHIGHO2_01_FULL_47_32]OGZ97987.1 MAG: hypothetical protein A3D57_02600 [Candidatus Sungbacteria bacterium RIFCSPHIGHO2_02_FULL_46_12]OHA06221.1 MAG: hypothetical protein A3A28_00105 [Candidatus Sungbacteria bacterium RIFCSPLOWO2_01_FULL_47_32]OHA11389.1 MAG: hypothetical protein A3H69_04490 [Candidatus Sungbacteria